ncbi:hypothetical protein RHGRI_012603 [Rhododendron griersonianum]|uniref:Uncharacterized protein n=1 Tax=Rhododendron griersonianum TaxID=479676 RepID=A0AAV6KS81_9ERIC|nr:hypothetical protein RHGRI_012603 [Rhododendron griersonianum]
MSKANSVSALPHFFRNSSYIPPSLIPTTPDDHLRSAIKTYKLYFNLNTTGELDGPALEQIVQPRCGVADIVNSTTSMNSGKKATSSGIHIHAVNHYSFFPQHRLLHLLHSTPSSRNPTLPR